MVVANGNKVITEEECIEVQWKIQNYLFCYNFKVNKLGGYDMRSGMNWMRIYNPIIFYFRSPKLASKIEGHQVTLHRIKVLDRLVELTSDKLNKMLKREGS